MQISEEWEDTVGLDIEYDERQILILNEMISDVIEFLNEEEMTMNVKNLEEMLVADWSNSRREHVFHLNQFYRDFEDMMDWKEECPRADQTEVLNIIKSSKDYRRRKESISKAIEIAKSPE